VHLKITREVKKRTPKKGSEKSKKRSREGGTSWTIFARAAVTRTNRKRKNGRAPDGAPGELGPPGVLLSTLSF